MAANKKSFNDQKALDAEQKRLLDIFNNLDINKKQLASKLIDNASFMSVTLETLKKKISVEGIKEEYKNGENQFGYKESVEVKNYNTIIKNYMNIIKQLIDLLPDNSPLPPEDEFDRFNL